MHLSEMFPRWRAASTNPHIPWEHDFDLAGAGHFGGLLALIAMDQSAASIERRAEFGPICGAVVEDILALRTALPVGADPSDLLYLQFEACLVPLQAALQGGALGEVHDWIITGLGEDHAHGVQRAIDPTRLAAFAFSNVGWIVANRAHTVATWATSFFYISRRSATLQEFGRAVLPAVLAMLDELAPGEEIAIEARAMIVSWAVVYAPDQARSLAAPLEAGFADTSLTLRARTQIAVMFASNGPAISDRPPADWASWALQEGALASHEPLQLIWHIADTVEMWDHVRSLMLAAITTYAKSLRTLRSPIAIAQATDQRSALLNPALVKMAAFDRADDLLAILQRWYDVPPAQTLAGGALIVSPNHHTGTAWLGARSQLLPYADAHPLAELTALANAALGLAISVQGEEIPLAVPEKPGEPNYDLGAQFHAALSTTYRISEVDPALFAGRTALIAFPGQPHPLQALLQDVRGETMPISASLTMPAPDRTVRRVLIWSADNDLFAGFEPDAVEQVLNAAGVECVRRSGAGTQPADFLAAYADPSFDVVWIAGHGEIDHWRHGSARIMAGAGNFVGIDELVTATPEGDKRRLLVLNICDGGVAAINGGIHRLGLAPMLASPMQATISHLWPVRPFVAAAFGALLAGGIAQGHEFFPAYASALAGLHGSSAEVTTAVRVVAPDAELTEHLARTDLQTENIFHWGSPVFFA